MPAPCFLLPSLGTPGLMLPLRSAIRCYPFLYASVVGGCLAGWVVVGKSTLISVLHLSSVQNRVISCQVTLGELATTPGLLLIQQPAHQQLLRGCGITRPSRADTGRSVA